MNTTVTITLEQEKLGTMLSDLRRVSERLARQAGDQESQGNAADLNEVIIGLTDPAALRLTDKQAMDRIHRMLTGTTWSSETIEWVAEVVTASGRTIEPPKEGW